MTDTFKMVSDGDYVNVRGAASDAAKLIANMALHAGYTEDIVDRKLKLMYYAGQLSYMRQVFSFGTSTEQQAKLSLAIHRLVNFCFDAEPKETTLIALHEVAAM